MSEGNEASVGAAALAARTAALGSAENLGPPDLCYLVVQQSTATGLLPSLRGLVLGMSEDHEPAATGIFHHLIGLDVSSPAPIAGYVADLAAEHPDTTSLSAVYCCWDALAGQDLRVHVSIPGGVSASALHPTAMGDIVEVSVDEQTWSRAAISATLRALCPLPPVAGMRSLQPAQPAEDDFLSAARQYLLRAASASFEGASAERAADSFDVAVDDLATGLVGPGAASAPLLVEALYHFFSHSFRFEQAVAFFEPLATLLACCAERVAAAQRALGQLPEAILTLGVALDAAPSDASLLIAQGELLLQCQMLDAAVCVATNAVQLGPSRRRAWMLLARVQLAKGWVVAALRTLNAAPVELLHEASPPGACELRRAAGKGASGRAHEVEAAQEHQRIAAYHVLAELLRDVGWERLLRFRSAAFAMEGEPTVPASDVAAVAEHGGSCAVNAATHGAGGDMGDGSGGLTGGGYRWTLDPTAHVPTSPRRGDNESGLDEAAPCTRRPLPGTVGVPSMDGPLRKPLCHAWLDELFEQLHADLVAMAAWRAEDERGAVADGSTAARQGGMEGGAATDRHSAAAGMPGGVPKSGQAEAQRWLERARLAERLLRPAEARAAYTRTVQAIEEVLDGTEATAPAEGAVRAGALALWTIACTTLMRLHATGDDEGASVTEALAASHRLLDECNSQSTTAAVGTAPVAPREVTACVYALVSAHGLQRVRAAQRSVGEAHPALNAIFHEVVERKVHGFDR